MPAVMQRPRFGVVDSTPDPAAQIKFRRTRLGMNYSELARESGIDRDTISKLEKGRSGVAHRDSTIGTLNTTLDRLESEVGMDMPSAVSDLAVEEMVEFNIVGNFGVSVVMKGPARNLPEMEEAAERLVERMGRKPSPES